MSRYKKSEDYLERALKTIPLGSQTFSKSMTHLPYGASPFFIQKGEGAYVWDLDGNKYIDFVCGLLSVSLGYNDPDVNTAVEKQLKQGVSFSLPHPIEAELAEKIVDMVPCAEMVRFGKNGSDATSGAIRIARAYTGRDHVATCGYHGWQDWYIGSTTRNLGVPKCVQDLTHTFKYNDLASLEAIFDKHPGQVAAVIMEPMNVEFPKDGFLEKVKALAHKNGAVLIFDEVITGFRFAKGGAQEYFGVIPDLACMGKGMANGFPISVVMGRKDLMKLMEDIFFSFTFGGEAVSLAAALATITKIDQLPVIDKVRANGEIIYSEVKKKLKKYKLQDCIDICGFPSWTSFKFKDSFYSKWYYKTMFMKFMMESGVMTVGSNNISYAHSQEDIEKLLVVYDGFFSLCSELIQKGTFEDYLDIPLMKPLFSVR